MNRYAKKRTRDLVNKAVEYLKENGKHKSNVDILVSQYVSFLYEPFQRKEKIKELQRAIEQLDPDPLERPDYTKEQAERGLRKMLEIVKAHRLHSTIVKALGKAVSKGEIFIQEENL